MEQLIALIVGYVIYRVLSNKDNAKRKPSQGPRTVSSPIPPKPKPKPPPEPEPVIEMDDDDDDDGMSYEPVTFEELLEQFGQAAKKRQGAAKPRELREKVYGIDDEFVPATDTRRQAAAEIKQFQSEHSPVKSLLTEDDLRDVREGAFKIREEQQSRYAKMLHNPESLRDAFIMKELLDRKYFDL